MMVSSVRKEFNEQFSLGKYKALLKDLDDLYPGAIEFRLAETPVFVPEEFTSKMISACESIVDLIIDPSFKNITVKVHYDLKIEGIVENEFKLFNVLNKKVV